MSVNVSTEDDMEQRANRRDDMPWQIKAAFLFGAPTVFAAYLIWALVSGIVPAMLAMQTSMNDLSRAVASLAADHAVAKMANEDILSVLRASCVNDAKTTDARERCLR